MLKPSIHQKCFSLMRSDYWGANRWFGNSQKNWLSAGLVSRLANPVRKRTRQSYFNNWCTAESIFRKITGKVGTGSINEVWPQHREQLRCSLSEVNNLSILSVKKSTIGLLHCNWTLKRTWKTGCFYRIIEATSAYLLKGGGQPHNCVMGKIQYLPKISVFQILRRNKHV